MRKYILALVAIVLMVAFVANAEVDVKSDGSKVTTAVSVNFVGPTVTKVGGQANVDFSSMVFDGADIEFANLELTGGLIVPEATFDEIEVADSVNWDSVRFYGSVNWDDASLLGSSIASFKRIAQTVVPVTSASTIALDTTLGGIFTLTPAHTATINAASVIAGREIVLVITTSGTSSFTLTFGTNFKTTGTLATGTTSGKVFVIRFVSDGTNWNETSRTTAM